MRNAKTLLTLCEERFPSPRPDQRHSLTLRDGVFVLTIMQGDTFQSFNLDDDDLDRLVVDVVDQLEGMLTASIVMEQVDVPTLTPPDEIA